jgi:ribosome-associated translation inhibitor RaiA
MATTQVPPAAVRVETMGNVPDGMPELAAAKVSTVLRHAARPVLFARVTLSMSADPAVERPAAASVNVDMNGRLVRAQAVGASMRSTIDQLADRLRVRLERAGCHRAR